MQNTVQSVFVTICKGCIPVTDSSNASLTVTWLMRTIHFHTNIRLGWFTKVLMVALLPDVLHQIIQQDLNVVGVDAGLLHWSVRTCLTLLAKGTHLNCALNINETHVENHHHTVGRPTSTTFGAFIPCNRVSDVLFPAWLQVVWYNCVIKLQSPATPYACGSILHFPALLA